MNREEVVALMESSASQAEWDTNINTVMEAFEGKYPEFWYDAIIQSGITTRVLASFGKSTDITVVRQRFRALDIYGRPTSMPFLKKDEGVVGVYDQGLGEKTVVCNSLADMQGLYDSYASGMALSLKWGAVSTSETTIPVP